MSGNVQLVKMTPSVENLSMNGKKTDTKANGATNGGFFFGFPGAGSGSEGATSTPLATKTNGASYENGFIRNREYGDFDT